MAFAMAGASARLGSCCFACAAWLSRVRPYAVWVVGSDVLLANRPLRLINRFSLGSAALVFANGAHLAERAKRQAPSATVENLLIGVDSEQFLPATRTGPARLFNHRWFAPVYDNPTIIRALALLPPDIPPFQMTFASGGPDLAAAKTLASEVLPARLRESVRFLDGKLRRHELLEDAELGAPQAIANDAADGAGLKTARQGVRVVHLAFPLNARPSGVHDCYDVELLSPMTEVTK